MYQVFYRKWRPKAFSEVVGQPHVTATLQNALQSGRLSHAYLFTGSRGTGKTSCAKILSKAVNCLNPVNGNPCNECEICRGIDSGSLTDIIEIDAASNNGVDNIRDLREETNFTPVRAKYRVYIIDEVHMLSTGAFNALLKTLEEPPSYVIFILATTEVHKLPQTILSRCQRFDFKRIMPDDIAQRLKFVAENENLQLTDDGANLIARIADGALRDALSILDRCAGADGKIDAAYVSEAVGIANRSYLFELSEYFRTGNTPGALELINNLHNNSCDMERLCSELINHFRNLMIVKTVKDPAALIICTADELDRLKKQAELYRLEDILYSLSVIEDTYSKIKRGLNQKIETEMAAVELCSPALLKSNEALLSRISSLEAKINAISSGDIKISPANTENKSKETPAPAVKNEAPEQEKQNATEKPEQTAPDRDENIPFMQWTEVLDELKQTDMPLAAILQGSQAFVRGEFILIKSQNSTFEQFIRVGSHSSAVKAAVLKISGKKYRLGILKSEEDQPANDPLAGLINKVNKFNLS
ncbi:MAG: DNA polymerase III subunit gamma/tau [Clostridiales bacterium]|nr:DNA polymerase III subunit gamma/tau [Clostridiales bacterium]